MNDGLALPAVLAFVAVLDHQGNFVLWNFLLRDVGGGLIVGLILAVIAARVAPKQLKNAEGHLIALYALGAALVTYGIATLTINANGLIAVFTGAIALGAMREDIQETFAERSDEIVELVKLSIFVVFGATVTLSSIFDWGWAAWAIVAVTFLVARPIGIGVSLAGTDLSLRAKAFMAWFGPKGVATMSFSLFVLGHLANSQEIVDIASLCVIVSIIAHGLTDVPGTNWIAKHSAEQPAGGDGVGQTGA
jgi:NhaP-type Na+/H+ or K+/H+ antiporter